MKKLTGVNGSEAMAKPLVITEDMVYIHTNIELVDEEKQEYSYDEEAYTKDEYLEKQSQDIDDIVLTLADFIGA